MLEIVSITIIKGSDGTAEILLHTNLPEAEWPYQSNAAFSLRATRSNSEDYCLEHFPNIPTKVVLVP